MVQVLCHRDRKDAIVNRVFMETTSIGIRYYEAFRNILFRESVVIETTFGPVIVKKVSNPDGSIRMIPEYEECKRIALERGLPYHSVYERIEKEAG